ncbi:TIGR02217 family protein [Tsuneonella flava]|uniref:TIGR02217 family protein n=1 Tax=Tsuneonella flava TaxID=2055955 RepID=A0ABX7K9H6_9SPHN|nr:TIGR02217 family protein [Tsuneonella flava]QSB44919.1 TIGR02217 family protein [Tsuneonella flava]
MHEPPLGFLYDADPSKTEQWIGALADRITRDERDEMAHDFRYSAHAGQIAPPGDWRVWLVMGGRGFGKTRAGAEWVRSVAESDGTVRIALVGASLGEARSVMVEGESGLVACSPPHCRPLFEPSLHRLRWPNGAQAFLYSAAEPESLRGPQHSHAWCDEIACDGERAMLETGDVLLPPYGIGIATAYDDACNQAPARLIRNARALGYRGELIHYVGMSHFFRLGSDGLATPDGALCGPARAWHGNFFTLCAATGFVPIVSLSFELLAQHCPDSWQQRTDTGAPARTGWEPPSALLSPASAPAMGWLQAVARRFVALAAEAGLPIRFQIGEPWWWIMPDGAPCIYDSAAVEAFGGDPVPIASLRQPLDPAQCDLLDRAGALLAAATDGIAQAVRDAASPAECTVMLLVFAPTVLDPATPEAHRANLPAGWAWPAYDRLQVEDYDWLTAGADALRRDAFAAIDRRLAYPMQQQDYLAGFVLNPGDAAALWPAIDRGLDQAAQRGIARRFVWALPQVARDGYVRLNQLQEEQVQPFDDVLYPLAPGRDAGASPEFSTSVAVMASGHERRNALWSDARLHFDVGPGIRSEAELGVLLAFFRARRGAARGFRLSDPFDHSSHAMTGTPTPHDQRIGTGDGHTTRFRLVKRYGESDDAQIRPITRPRAGSVAVSVAGVVVHEWTLEPGGWVVFAAPPAAGTRVCAGFLFDVPVRFAQDRLDVNGATFAAGEAPSVPLIEVREAS